MSAEAEEISHDGNDLTWQIGGVVGRELNID